MRGTTSPWAALVLLLAGVSVPACDLCWELDGAPGECPAAESLVDDADDDGVLAIDDCDDDDPAVFPGAAELCNGVDDDCDGRADEAAECWVTIHRFRGTGELENHRCWGASKEVPGACQGFVYERIAWYAAASPLTGDLPLVQCSLESDHIITATDEERAQAEAAGYSCESSVGHGLSTNQHPTIRGPSNGPELCKLWRYSGPGHLFTIGEDLVWAWTCEPPARAWVVPAWNCFDDPAPGCD